MPMKSGSGSSARPARHAKQHIVNQPAAPGGHRRKKAVAAAIGGLIATSLTASAATIDMWQYSVDDPDTISSDANSLLTSTLTNRIGRFRMDTGSISKMVLGVVPNTNLVAIETNAWFTTRDAPYRIGRADLGTVSGNPVYYAALPAAYDDMVLGPDNTLGATSAGSGTVVRITQAGAATTFTGDGTIRPLGIARGGDGNVWFADGANRRITRVEPGSGALTHYPVPQLSSATVPERVVAMPTTGAMWFATQDGFGSVDPATGVVQVAATEPQQPKHMAAAADGTIWLTNGTGTVTRFTPPASYARLKVFTDPYAQSSGIYVDRSGAVYVTDRWNAMLARIAPAAETPADTTVAEFYNAALDHYFVTADPVEAAAIDTGAAGPEWTRTGQTWGGWLSGPVPDAAEVCRFYGSPDVNPETGARRGPNSHFYTLEPSECASVKSDAGWKYEAAAKFWMAKPAAGTCPSWAQPIYRAYNDGFATNNSNHRYTVSPTIYSEMTAKGWRGEGVVMCAPLG
jgi:streptogramin lyase